MNLRKSLALMEKYAECPQCHNNTIGAGEGVLIVEDETFFRSCKCGWSIKTDEEGKELD